MDNKEGEKMHLYYYENENLNKIIDDGIRDFVYARE
jgi:hypothetical protein